MREAGSLIISAVPSRCRELIEDGFGHEVDVYRTYEIPIYFKKDSIELHHLLSVLINLPSIGSFHRIVDSTITGLKPFLPICLFAYSGFVFDLIVEYVRRRIEQGLPS